MNRSKYHKNTPKPALIMKANSTSQAGERTQENDSFPIDIMVKSFGNWALGYGWVTVNIGGNDVTGLALYARHTGRNGEQKDPVRRVVANVKEATCWLLDTVKVPAKYSGRLMAAAMNAGDFGDICKNHPTLATATPTTRPACACGNEGATWGSRANGARVLECRDCRFARGESERKESCIANPRSEQKVNAAAFDRVMEDRESLKDALKNLCDAIWDGRLESEGAEAFTDEAYHLLAKVEAK